MNFDFNDDDLWFEEEPTDEEIREMDEREEDARDLAKERTSERRRWDGGYEDESDEGEAEEEEDSE